jgi:prepilin-type N-terminal cleavage/methylation domain-containing protein
VKLNKNQQGFTLIELVIVIIILGILSVTATSKFLSLSSEAQASSVHDLAGSIASINQSVHSKTQIDGIADKRKCSGSCNGHPNWDSTLGYFYIDASGTRLYVANGYPKSPLSTSPGSIPSENYRKVMGLSDDDFVFGRGFNSSLAIVPKKFENKLAEITIGDFKCHVEYSSPIGLSTYFVKAFTDNC